MNEEAERVQRMTALRTQSQVLQSQSMGLQIDGATFCGELHELCLDSNDE